MNKQPHIKQILADRKLAPRKKLGQNFLSNQQTATRIAALSNGGPDDTIIELGVGLGSLTQPLAAQVGRVIGIEIDAGIIAWHQEKQDLPDNVTLIHQDLLKTDYQNLARECGGRLKIIANLPYSVSSPLIFKLLDEHLVVESAVLMLQKEVADRLTAPVGTKEYGILTVMVATCAKVKKLLDVPPSHFHPQPKVDSTVVRLDFSATPEIMKELSETDRALMKKIVRASFQQRRKTLLNSLSAANINDIDKKSLSNLIDSCSINPGARAETLTVADFISLTHAIAR